MKDRKVLAIIDGKSVFYRGFYAMPNLSTSNGIATGGVYGFATLAIEIIKRINPTYVAVAWDKAKTNTSKRTELYPAYKANRSPAPPDFYEQIPILKDLLEKLGWPLYEADGYEADDIMGSFAHQAEKLDLETILISSDLDLLQLISSQTKIYTIKKGFSNITKFDDEEFIKKYQITPSQFIDYKALCGDSSDNIPGVAGIGPKSSTELLQQYKTLDGIYENLWQIKPSIQSKLESGKDSAYLSKILATILLDYEVELKEELKNMHGIPPDPLALRVFLESLEFKNLIRLLPEYFNKNNNITGQDVIKEFGSNKKLESKKLNQKDITSVNDLSKIDFNKEVFCYLRCKGKRAQNPELFLIHQNEDIYILNEEFLNKNYTNLEDFFNKLKVVCFNSKQILHFYNNFNYSINSNLLPTHDLEITSFNINSNRRYSSLEGLIEAELHITLDLQVPKEDIFKNLDELFKAMKVCYEKQAEFLDQNQALNEVIKTVDIAVLPAIVQMESEGINFNQKANSTTSKALHSKLDNLVKEIHLLAGREFNIASPVQLSEVLFKDLGLSTAGIKKGKTGISTAAGELEKLIDLHPIIILIIRWRQIAKLTSTYSDSLPRMVEADGKIHTNLNIVGAATGRLSSQDPNLQNIPIKTEQGKLIREAFEAPKGYKIISADYSQFELRIAAAISKDEELISIFNSNETDIHTETAAKLYNKPSYEVTKQERYNAKAINFGILYGQSAHGLALGTGMNMAEARIFLHKFKEVRRNLFIALDEILAKAKTNGYVETLLGRRRVMNDINSSNYLLRSAAERAAINMPIQGTAADITKLAMIKLYDLFKDTKIKQILQIHDSIMFICPNDLVEETSKIIKNTMEQTYPNLGVKMRVDISDGDKWSDL
jgi:DNA polymerase-1